MTINVLEYLERAAERSPAKTVFTDADGSVDYRTVLGFARSIGTALCDTLGGARNRPVAVALDRAHASLIAFLGVVSSGNFYVPIDLELPSYRIRLILDALKPAAMILPRSEHDRFFSMQQAGMPVLCHEEAMAVPADGSRLQALRRQMIDTDPLYTMFTSGSTGQPKGVLVSHRSVIDLVEQFIATFDLSADCVFGNQAPFDFDISVKDLFLTLGLGASMSIIPRQLFAVPARLMEMLNSAGINTLIWSVSALRLVANWEALERNPPSGLRLVMFSGEVMPPRILNYWHRALPSARFVNLYGPTEITCNCTFYNVDRAFSDAETLPIGRPFRNTDILLLDEENRLVQAGESGEICVRGSSLALGYINAPELTAEVFCQNPLNTAYPERIYRTGDIGMRNPEGDLLFLGRKDAQVKHLGHRVELGEIEAVANQLPFVMAAACLHDRSADRLILCYQSAEACDGALASELRSRLPRYMQPDRLVHTRMMPVNRTGKIDRNRLREEQLHAAGA